MSEKRLDYDLLWNNYYQVIELDDGDTDYLRRLSPTEIIKRLNEQQAIIEAKDSFLSIISKENEQLKNELRKEKSLREYSDSMYDADLIVNIRFSNGEWKADVSVIDDE